MQLHTIDNVLDWNQLASEWNELLSRSAARVPFLRHEYLAAWWPDLGQEWHHGKLHVVTARHNAKLVAAAPLFVTADDDELPLLTLVGSDMLSDYLDLVA